MAYFSLLLFIASVLALLVGNLYVMWTATSEFDALLLFPIFLLTGIGILASTIISMCAVIRSRWALVPLLLFQFPASAFVIYIVCSA